MNIAVVAGGWHYPMHFFKEMAAQEYPRKNLALFVVGHRHPDLAVVREEKVSELSTAPGPLGNLDRMLYGDPVSLKRIIDLGWTYIEAPNLAGDQVFLNQWLDRCDYRHYDVILNCHDDTFIRRRDLLQHVVTTRREKDAWLILANGKSPVESDAYFRGSFEFWHRDMIDLMGGKVPVGDLTMTRVGATDTPKDRETLQAWNAIGVPARNFILEADLTAYVARLSPHYRVSKWVIEGERGFIYRQASAPEWRMDKGLEAYPL
jgi:hypothetical protein